MKYAENTSVPVGRSKAEVEKTLRRYGASAFAYGWDDTTGAEVIMFSANGRRIRYELRLPDRDDTAFTLTPTGRERSPKLAEEAWEMACRQAWRALALVIKAKFAAIEAGVTSFEDEFLAGTVLPSGKTVGAWVAPAIVEAYSTGVMPPMLALGTSS